MNIGKQYPYIFVHIMCTNKKYLATIFAIRYSHPSGYGKSLVCSDVNFSFIFLYDLYDTTLPDTRETLLVDVERGVCISIEQPLHSSGIAH